MNYNEIKKALAEPVPSELISHRQQGGFDIAFVNVTNCKDLLDDRVGHWNAFVHEFKQIGESICVVVRLRIHADDGVYEQDGTGIKALSSNSYGDPFSNAYAQAFRRACEGHGLSREFWRRTAGEARRTNETLPPPRPANHGQERGLGLVATAKQIGAINSLGRKLGIDTEQECRSIIHCDLRNLTKRDASTFIDHLNGLANYRKAA